jgi:hypothetical protein
LFKTCDRSIQRSRSKPRSAEMNDVLDHGVPVLRAVGETRQDKEGWI